MRTSKLRTFLTGFSVAWGILMLIVLLSISNGIINSANEDQEKSDIYKIHIWGGITTMPYNGLKEGRQITFKLKDLEAVRNADPSSIIETTSIISVPGQVSTSRDYLSDGAQGMYPSAIDGEYEILTGRKLNDADIRETRKVMMLHQESADLLFGDYMRAIGKHVRFNKASYTIIGVYKHKWDKSCFIPFTTAYALTGFTGILSQMDVRFKKVNTVDESVEISDKIKEALAKSLNYNPDDPAAIYIHNEFVSHVEESTALNILNYTMWTIGLLTLITGIVGVSNIMFVSVRERTHEIGIRRAIGAKPRNILSQVLLESVSLTTVFGYLGIIIGTLVTEIVKVVFTDSEFMLNPSVDLSIAFEVTIALIIAGALAGIFPALRAIKIRPVEALQEE